MATNSRGKVSNIVREICEPLAAEMDLSIWDVRYVKEGSDWFLKILIDKESGVGIEDCEKFSRAADKLIDASKTIDDHYYFEVSSAGIERELFSSEHFEYAIGKDVVVKLYKAIDGAKEITGKLIKYSKDCITVLESDNEITLSTDDYSKVKTKVDF